MTCWGRVNAKPSRIDGFVVNPEALMMIDDFYVEKDEGIPTHAVVGLKISRSTEMETRRFAKSLPSLKKLFDQKVNEIEKVKGEEGVEESDKVKAERRRKEIGKFHECMDAELSTRMEMIRAYRRMKDVEGLWSTISQCIEEAWLKYLEMGKEMKKQSRGRGKLTIIEKKLGAQERHNEKDTPGNEWYHQAVGKLRQTRRCEQAAYRIALRNNEGKVEVYTKLNEQTIGQN